MLRYIHFVVNVSLQFILLIAAYYQALKVYRNYFDAALNGVPVYLSLLGVFLAVYFTLMWKELYAHKIHSYLKITVSIIGKNLAIASLSVIFVVLIEFIILDQFDFIAWKAIIFFGFGISTLFLMHVFYYLWLKSLSIHGYFHKKVMLVGQSSSRFHVEKFFQDMGDTKEFCGTLSLRADGIPPADKEDGSEAIIWQWDQRAIWEKSHVQRKDELECASNFMDIVYRHHIGELIIFLGPRLSEKAFQSIVKACDTNDIGYYVVPDLSTLPHTKYWNNIFSYIPIIAHYTTNRDNLFNISIKRIFDIIVSVAVLLCFLPIGAVISLLIFLRDGGPVFYTSHRVGKDGQIIPFFKFRSMRRNAEQLKKELLALNERRGAGPLFKIKRDPRVTRIGHFLRRTSLDEFPQFVNVLLGHLSIIGPRPHLPEEVKDYEGKDFMRLECMPGITCLPQLRDRDHMGFHEWINFDLYYRKNWTLGLDFSIFWKTGVLFFKSFFVKEDSGG